MCCFCVSLCCFLCCFLKSTLVEVPEKNVNNAVNSCPLTFYFDLAGVWNHNGAEPNTGSRTVSRMTV